mmetsp:Transcript_1853/g.2512  ORF Transcript_1853/g.2512 Transcript_1853/m.2512 type:complete len:109 (-) Transcript_1853:2003-2329(-)
MLKRQASTTGPRKNSPVNGVDMKSNLNQSVYTNMKPEADASNATGDELLDRMAEKKRQLQVEIDTKQKQLQTINAELKLKSSMLDKKQTKPGGPAPKPASMDIKHNSA